MKKVIGRYPSEDSLRPSDFEAIEIRMVDMPREEYNGTMGTGPQDDPACVNARPRRE